MIWNEPHLANTRILWARKINCSVNRLDFSDHQTTLERLHLCSTGEKISLWLHLCSCLHLYAHARKVKSFAYDYISIICGHALLLTFILSCSAGKKLDNICIVWEQSRILHLLPSSVCQCHLSDRELPQWPHKDHSSVSSWTAPGQLNVCKSSYTGIWTDIFFFRFERVLGPCSDILKRNIQQYNSFVSLSV